MSCIIRLICNIMQATSFGSFRWNSPRSHLTSSATKKNKPSRYDWVYFFGGRRWIRTTESVANRFTVCPL
jgi:hypothetical protein